MATAQATRGRMPGNEAEQIGTSCKGLYIMTELHVIKQEATGTHTERIRGEHQFFPPLPFCPHAEKVRHSICLQVII